jgi:HSP20 family protein
MDAFDAWNPLGFPFGRLFEDFWEARPANAENRLVPALDVTEDDDFVTVCVEAPGLRKEDVKVEFADGVLTFSGEKKYEAEKKGRTYHRIERRYGTFARSLVLPTTVRGEAASADMKDGLLRVVLPKREEAKARAIQIK